MALTMHTIIFVEFPANGANAANGRKNNLVGVLNVVFLCGDLEDVEYGTGFV